MIRMLLLGYCYGIRHERRPAQEVALHLGYRWFTPTLGICRQPLSVGMFDPILTIRCPCALDRSRKLGELEIYRGASTRLIRCLECQ
jgi:hypothetical protein